MSLCLMKLPGKSFLMFWKEDLTSWEIFPVWSENVGMKQMGGGSSVFLLRPWGVFVLSFAIQNCSLSIRASNSFIGKRPPTVCLEISSTGVIVRESTPPQLGLLKCSATGVLLLFLISERCWTRRSWTDVLVWPTYLAEHDLHSITYMTGVDWQLSECFISMHLLLGSLIELVDLMKGQVLQLFCLHGDDPPEGLMWGLSCFRV